MQHSIPFSPLLPRKARRPHAVLAVAVLSASIALVGCENLSERQKGTATGAGVGAVGGAVIGSATGGKAGTGALIGGAVGAIAGNLWSKRMEDKRKAMEQASSGTPVAIDRTADNRLKVNVPSDVSFQTGSATIRPEMRPVLDELGRNLDGTMRVTIVGHTDSTGSDAINDPLSLERAEAVRDYLTARGANRNQVGVSGRGSREPVSNNTTDSGRAANRRVEIFLAETQG